MRRTLAFAVLLVISLTVWSQTSLETVRDKLLNSPVQEKVFLHIDNTCYFKGDTICYKAYVVRADSLTYTDMSRILYVELVSPDGMVVERQQVIVSPQGYSDGNFALKDSIYSGFYELRAYTRWMLNFKVSHHDYGRKDREFFYNSQMAEDFFRQFETVYGRVVPVYERPEQPGDYAMKYIVNRPKTVIDKELKEKLTVNFYPEGGHLVAGRRCNVAFEAVNEEGELVDIEGRIDNMTIKTEHQGRGAFMVDVPESGHLTADFSYKGKEYHIDLPKAERDACALILNDGDTLVTARLTLGNRPTGSGYAVAVMCRGVLKNFQVVEPDDKGQAVVSISKRLLPTGVCDLIVVDETGRALADRLFFVNHHDYDRLAISVEGNDTYEPFEQIQLHFQAPADARHISIAVRDGATDEPTYDTGNMLTDLLLSSELKGFIAYPHYYFETDDARHRRHLDLLMQVQGWRRYDYEEMTADAPLRYKPETAITIEGSVYPTADSDEFEPDEVRYWAIGVFGYSPSHQENVSEDNASIVDSEKGDEKVEGMDRYQATTPDDLVTQLKEGSLQAEQVGTALYVKETADTKPKSADNPYFGINHGGLRHEVTVEGELVLDDDIATIKMETDHGGHFAFSVPPYYGQGILFLKAYKTDVSEKKLKRLNNKGVLDETAWPEYYVKRDLFYPVFAKKYSWYQCHLPEEFLSDDNSAQGSFAGDTGEALSIFDRELKGVTVKRRRRRGRSAVDYSKPACVYDAQELYNLATDRGLSFGHYEANSFPVQMSMALLGNYNSDRALQVKARLNDLELTPYVFFRNYDPGFSASEQFRSDVWINRNIKLNRQNEIRIYTDFELRNEDKRLPQQTGYPDVTLDFMLMPEEGMRYTYRDRRIIFDGMTEPASFYHPDYAKRPLPTEVNDYRRTLYWNPNAQLDSEGRFTATFYNNGKQTRIKVDAAGLTHDGKPVVIKK